MKRFQLLKLYSNYFALIIVKLLEISSLLMILLRITPRKNSFCKFIEKFSFLPQNLGFTIKFESTVSLQKITFKVCKARHKVSECLGVPQNGFATIK